MPTWKQTVKKYGSQRKALIALNKKLREIDKKEKKKKRR